MATTTRDRHAIRPDPAAPRMSAGLRREIGFVGLLWASGGSIIGSGWLFGAQEALITADPAARCGGTSASLRPSAS